jgi:hypothetical protein
MTLYEAANRKELEQCIGQRINRYSASYKLDESGRAVATLHLMGEYILARVNKHTVRLNLVDPEKSNNGKKGGNVKFSYFAVARRSQFAPLANEFIAPCNLSPLETV